MRPPSSGLLPRRLLAERAILSERRVQRPLRGLLHGSPRTRPPVEQRVTRRYHRRCRAHRLAERMPRAPRPPAHWSSASYASPRQAVSLVTPVIISVGVSAKTGFERAPAEQAP